MATKKQPVQLGLIQSNINIAAPNSWHDTFIRAAKTFVIGIAGGLPVSTLAEFDISTLKILALSAGASAAGVILNRVLAWASS